MSTAIAPPESAAIAGAQILATWADEVIRAVEEESDERLIEIASTAKHLEEAAFRVRGACGMELKKRISHRITYTTGTHEPLGKQLSALAKEIGVATSTLQEDIRIAETFPEVICGDTRLDREFYRFALAAPDPHEAIEMAVHKKAKDPSYSCRNFHKEVMALSGGKSKAKVESGIWVNELLSDEALPAWEKLQEHYASNAEALSAAIIKLAEEIA